MTPAHIQNLLLLASEYGQCRLIYWEETPICWRSWFHDDNERKMEIAG